MKLEAQATEDKFVRDLIAAANAREQESLFVKSEAAFLGLLLQDARNLLCLSHDTIFRLHDNQDIAARELLTKIRFWLSSMEK